MELRLPISDRARKYGYIFWKKKEEKQVRKFLGDRNDVDLFFFDEHLGNKRVDWKIRRISVGSKRTRNLPAKFKNFVLKFNAQGEIKMLCQ